MGNLLMSNDPVLDVASSRQPQLHRKRRKQLFKGWPVRFLFRLSAFSGTGVQRYTRFRWWLRWVAGSAWARRVVWPKETALLQRFFSTIELPSVDEARAMQQSLINNAGHMYWKRLLQQCTRHELEQVVVVHDPARLHQLHHNPTGTIFVHCHGTFARIFWLVLDQYGLQPGATIGGVTNSMQARGLSSVGKIPRSVEYTRQLVIARRTLKEGGTVHILPDGFSGTGDHSPSVAFFDRLRSFPTGFAELALMTKAIVVPVHTFSDTSGQIHVVLPEPFDAAGVGLSHTERIEALVQQYVSHLSHHWTTAPHDIMWQQMKAYLTFAPADPADGTQTTVMHSEARQTER